MQALYVDTGNGPVDFTRFVYAWDSIDIKKNEPWLFDFSIAFVDGVPGWSEIKRGAYVRFEDSRWESRSPGVPDGVVITGYVTEDPEYVFLGTRNNESVFGFKVRCSSDDYLINSKKVPSRTFINKTRGFILRALLKDMFGATAHFNVDNIQDGGTERIYQTDPKKPWTEIAMDFAKADGYVYWALDGHLFYLPEPTEAPVNVDPKYTLILDEKDPRFNPDQIAIKQVSDEVANDVTVFGLDEPSSVCHEEFISDGYQGDHPLSFLPYGVEEADVLTDDFTTGTIDESKWEERDEQSDFIQMFEGALNIVGGPGMDTGTAFVRSLKGIELSGVTAFRDGEIYFPPGINTTIAQGYAIIGGLFTEDDCKFDNLWCGWALAPGNYIYPVTKHPISETSGPFWTGFVKNTPVFLNPAHHFILRREVTTLGFASMPIEARIPGVQAGFPTPPAFNYGSLVRYLVEEIDFDDPSNVVKTTHDLGTMLLPFQAYVLYAPVVTWGGHLVVNNVQVSKPSQVSVTVDGVYQKVGSYLDGGRCAIVPDGNRAKLAWYSVMGTSVSLNEAERSSQQVTTIPARMSRIGITYYRSQKARARIQSASSIASERQKFKDDGIRQLTMEADEVTPSPKTSEECLLVAQALLADRQEVKWEGTFEFLTKADDPTELRRFPLPGDRIPLKLDTPDGSELNTVVDVTSVECQPVGKDVWHFTVGVGPVNQFDQVQRELTRRRSSSLDEVVIHPEEIETAELISENGYDWIPDPADPQIASIDASSVTITLNPWGDVPPGATGWEVRTTDSGWGSAGYVYRGSSPLLSLPRDRRDRVVFVRTYRQNADGSLKFSRRSALCRYIVPRPNAMTIAGIEGELSKQEVTFFLPLPKDADFAGVHVYGPDLAVTNTDTKDLEWVSSATGTLYKTKDPHGFSTGDTVHVTGSPTAHANGDFVIRAITPAESPDYLYLFAVDSLNGAGTVEFGGKVRKVVASGSGSPVLLYSGDGVTHLYNAKDLPNATEVLAFIENGRIVLTVRIIDPAYLVATRSYPIWVYTFNFLNEVGPQTFFNATKQAPVVTTPPTVDPFDEQLWRWEGSADSWRVSVYDEGGQLENSWTLPGEVTEYNFGRQGRTTRVEIEGLDSWGLGDMGSGSFEADEGVPEGLSLNAAVVNSYALINWSASVNAVTISDWELQASASPDFSNAESAHFSGDTLNTESLAQGATLWFRIRATNSFGTSNWSSAVQTSTGQDLDPISAGNVYDPNNPVINPDWRAGGIAGYKVSQINDGAGRSFAGLLPGGFVGLDLPFSIFQLNSGGARFPIIRGDNDVRSLSSGQTTWDGSVRGYNALNPNYYLQTGLLTVPIFDGTSWRNIIHNANDVRSLVSGQSIWDGSFRSLAVVNQFNQITGVLVGSPIWDGVIFRPIAHNGHDVRFFSNGQSIWDGGFRSLAGLNVNAHLQTAIIYGVGMFNSGGGYYGIMRAGDPESNIDLVPDGGTYVRPTYFQRDGGQRAGMGLDGNGYLISGILQRFGAGYISYASIDDRGWRSEQALGVDGNRVQDFKCDQYSLIAGCVVGETIYGPYRSVNGLTSDGTGYHRAIDRNS